MSRSSRMYWKSRQNNMSRPRRNWRAAKDMQLYRHHYPNLDVEDDGVMWNVEFYRNQICFRPHGCKIEEILNNWKGDYLELENNHCYIQWLFPLRERGVNMHAFELTQKEIEVFKKDADVRRRLTKAYELMLDFYGIKLLDEKTGKVARTAYWKERFDNLNRRSHNNLRITRILKCLGELGFEHYQAPLVSFFLTEVLKENQLWNVRHSLLDYFVFSIRDKRQRRELLLYAWKHTDPSKVFLWAPVAKLKAFQDLRNKKDLDNHSISQEEDGCRPIKRRLTDSDKHGKSSAGEVLNTNQSSGSVIKHEEENKLGMQDLNCSLSSECSKKKSLADADQKQVSGHPFSSTMSGDVDKMEEECESPTRKTVANEGPEEVCKDQATGMFHQCNDQHLQKHCNTGATAVHSQNKIKESEGNSGSVSDANISSQPESKIQDENVAQKLHSLTIGDHTEQDMSVDDSNSKIKHLIHKQEDAATNDSSPEDIGKNDHSGGVEPVGQLDDGKTGSDQLNLAESDSRNCILKEGELKSAPRKGEEEMSVTEHVDGIVPSQQSPAEVEIQILDRTASDHQIKEYREVDRVDGSETEMLNNSKFMQATILSGQNICNFSESDELEKCKEEQEITSVQEFEKESRDGQRKKSLSVDSMNDGSCNVKCLKVKGEDAEAICSLDDVTYTQQAEGLEFMGHPRDIKAGSEKHMDIKLCSPVSESYSYKAEPGKSPSSKTDMTEMPGSSIQQECKKMEKPEEENMDKNKQDPSASDSTSETKKLSGEEEVHSECVSHAVGKEGTMECIGQQIDSKAVLENVDNKQYAIDLALPRSESVKHAHVLVSKEKNTGLLSSGDTSQEMYATLQTTQVPPSGMEATTSPQLDSSFNQPAGTADIGLLHSEVNAVILQKTDSVTDELDVAGSQELESTDTVTPNTFPMEANGTIHSTDAPVVQDGSQSQRTKGDDESTDTDMTVVSKKECKNTQQLSEEITEKQKPGTST
ncbi:opioid growth factor receptor [Protopterus annectens]|uniref:opioid growth factor receptor n=1 Tax=Protopterus annectens TaxID=7888 RepID=UPI001CFC0695|nr:opioid growth factor receptor [Protopterus annectens]